MAWGSRAGDARRRTTPSLHTQNTTAARPTVRTHKPAVENRPRVRLADLFERAKPRSGPSLTGERRPLSFRDGNTQASNTRNHRDGSSTTTTASTGHGNVTVSQKKKGTDGSEATGSVSATRDSATVSGSASSNGVGVNGSVTANADGVTVRAGGSAEVKGLKIKFGTEISQTSNVESKDGFTTLTATGSMSVNLGGEVDLGAVGFGGNITEGVKTKYQLRMSDADYAKVRSGQAPMPDPYNPDTMPAGSSVLLNSTDFQNTGFEASYRNLKLETNVSHEQGLSVAVEKTGANTVRVTAGPTEAVQNSFKLGLNLGPASAHIGNTARLDQFKLKTAEFDLSTDTGRAAYNAFLTTGKLPTQNGNGISNVATVEKIQYNSTTSAGASLGPLSGSVDLANSNLNIVKTTYPDGSVDQVTDAKLHAGTPVHLEQHFKPDGTEDFSKQKISMFMAGANGGAEELFASAYDVNQHDFDGDDDIHLSFTADQAMALSQRAQDHMARWERDNGKKWSESSHIQDDLLIEALAKADDPTDVARALIGAYGGPGWMGQAFVNMAIVGDEFVPLPGTIEARNRND
ncbi:hypothetical protein [Hyalangium sp.]|uniref:hypothetical protein n=1 Tax=Hyalangium sp. TaxID=2028555 RepID=UPI002D6BADF3|nr:hypothetical protein [Hyalangium sp.]HYH99446.1 hypothetical protein [Hyalangium sp.]